MWNLADNQAQWSEGMYHLFGVDPRTFENTNDNFLQIVHPEDRLRMQDAMLQALQSGGRFLQDYRIIRPDGQVRYLTGEGDIIPDSAGKAHQMYGFVQDITLRRESESALATAHQELRNLNAFKTRFLNMVAHDLNNVLTGMILSLPVIPQQIVASGGTASKALDRVKAGTKNLARFLADLLEVARIQADHLILSMKEFDLIAALREVADTHGAHASEKGVKLEVQAPDQVQVVGDVHRLDQVLTNLLSNAIKFTPPGGLVGVTVAENGDSVTVTVTDTGLGLEATDLDKIFEPFTQLGAITQGKHTGTGLGLYICRNVVELHGGRITCQSPGAGRGSTFSFWLPKRSQSTATKDAD